MRRFRAVARQSHIQAQSLLKVWSCRAGNKKEATWKIEKKTLGTIGNSSISSFLHFLFRKIRRFRAVARQSHIQTHFARKRRRTALVPSCFLGLCVWAPSSVGCSLLEGSARKLRAVSSQPAKLNRQTRPPLRKGQPPSTHLTKRSNAARLVSCPLCFFLSVSTLRTFVWFNSSDFRLPLFLLVPALRTKLSSASFFCLFQPSGQSL